MKLGTNACAFPASWSLEECFRAAQAIGYDGVELLLSEQGALNVSSGKDDLKNIRKLAERYQIELYSLSTGLYWRYSLTSDDASVRDTAKGIVKKQLEAASELGCDTILVVPGCVHADFIGNCPIVSYDDAYARACDWLCELAPLAERCGVTIGIENVWNKFLLSPLEMRDLIDRVKSRAVGAYFDVGNAVYSGFPEQWIRILGPRIKKVHLKDFRRSVGHLGGFVSLASGDVNYPAVIRALKDIDYDGYLTAEPDVCRDYPMHGLKATFDAMKAIRDGE